MTFFRLSAAVAVACSVVIPGAGGGVRAQAAIQAESSRAPAILLPVTVVDRDDAHVPGLDASAFTVREKNKPLTIAHVSAARAPTSFGFMLDTSASMESETLRYGGAALQRIMSEAADGSDFLVVGVNSTLTLFDWTTDTSVVAKNVRSISGRSPAGSSALNEAIIWSLDRLASGTHARRVLVAVSDGRDTSSVRPIDRVRDTIRQSAVVVYMLVPRGRDGFRPLPGLPDAVKRSGGQALEVRTADGWTEAVERVAAELRNHYWLHVIPTAQPDDKWHTVKVTVTPPDGRRVSVRAPDGYYLPKQ